MENLDVVVIGAGIIGLSIARKFALLGREVIVLEKNKTFGQEISSRNSEVIHAGIYYPPGSLKAQCCVNGKEMLYDYCADRQIAHKKIGKLIVATSPQEKETLNRYIQNATNNGVQDLQLLDSNDVKHLEPRVRCSAAVFSPSTGIVDSHGLMYSFIADIEANNGIVVYNSPILSGNVNRQHFILNLEGNSAAEVKCNLLINAGGLNAIDIALRLGIDTSLLPKAYLAKGHYFALSGNSPFTHLVYPVANSAGLGIHATLDLNGQVKFGPDVEWIKHENYSVPPERSKVFADEISRYYPSIKKQDLQPSYAGIRPKITGPGKPAADFYIQGSAEHGIANLINLFGIESPGLTACLAIAEYIGVKMGSA